MKASFLKYWLPVWLWMAVIFAASSDSQSGQHSSRLIGPLLRWLKPDISEAGLEQVTLVARKASHVSEFAILAMLLCYARRQPRRGDTRPWEWSEAAFAVGGAALYAASDEIHQAFVPTRQGCLTDVLIDTSGAILGIALIWLLDCLRNRRLVIPR